MGSPLNPSVKCPTLSGHGLAHPKRSPSSCGAQGCIWAGIAWPTPSTPKRHQALGFAC